METDLLQLGIGVVVIEGIVASLLKILNFVLLHTKDENVFHSHLFCHLHVGSIKSTNSQSSVQLFALQ